MKLSVHMYIRIRSASRQMSVYLCVHISIYLCTHIFTYIHMEIHTYAGIDTDIDIDIDIVKR